jgi:hypothetical protein
MEIRNNAQITFAGCIRSWRSGDRSDSVSAMAIGRLRVLEARIEKLSVGKLTVDYLNVRSPYKPLLACRSVIHWGRITG